MSGLTAYTIPEYLPPSWASAYGEDDFGVFAEFEIESVKFEFRWIPPGTFRMGSPEDEKERAPSEGPRHVVTISQGFWMGTGPVTQAQWKVVMGKGSDPSHFKGEDRPVEQVGWEDCQTYVAKLRKLVAGLEAGLPTEAQWEYACRAGTETPFSFGGELNGTQANCDGRIPYGTPTEGPYLRESREAGSYPPNPWGLYDVHGNVLEWCQDGFREYGNTPVSDPVGPLGKGTMLALRGGGWRYSAKSCRSASRIASLPGNLSPDLGFRLVAGQPDPEPEPR